MEIKRVKLDEITSEEEFKGFSEGSKHDIYREQCQITEYWWNKYYELVELKHRFQAIDYLISHAIIIPSKEVEEGAINPTDPLYSLSWQQMYETLISVYQIANGNFKYLSDKKVEPVVLPDEAKPKEEEHENNSEV